MVLAENPDAGVAWMFPTYATAPRITALSTSNHFSFRRMSSSFGVDSELEPLGHDRQSESARTSRNRRHRRDLARVPRDAVDCRDPQGGLQSRSFNERTMTILSPGSPSARAPADDRLDSWKEIAAYMKRDVTTVQRWEKREGMPVHRHVHDKMGSVYAFRTDLDAWARSRNLGSRRRKRPGGATGRRRSTRSRPSAVPAVPRRPRRAAWRRLAAGGDGSSGRGADDLAAPTARQRAGESAGRCALSAADRLRRDRAGGRALARREIRGLSLRSRRSNGRVGHPGWHRSVLQPHSGRVHGSSPTRRFARWASHPTERSSRSGRAGPPVPSQTDISVWAAPVLGGQPRPYLDGVAEFDWSSDGARLVYHTPGPGDPMFVRDSGQASEARAIFTAPPGLHSHFPIWSPDHAFIYFVQGSVPDRMDVWRIRRPAERPNGSRITTRVVSHPVFLNARTLLYLASDSDGFGPWIYSLDVERRISRRVSVGIDRYTSLAASADGSRLVATLATSEEHALAPADHRCTRRVVGRPSHPADHRQRILSEAGRRLPAVRLFQGHERQHLEAARRGGHRGVERARGADHRRARHRARRASHCVLDQAERADVAVRRECRRHRRSHRHAVARAARRSGVGAGRAIDYGRRRQRRRSASLQRSRRRPAHRRAWWRSILSIPCGRPTAISSCSRGRTSGRHSRSRP